LFLLIALPVRADVRYVDVDAPVSGSGNAWCDAFTDLQDALAIAQAGDEIRIAAGTYTPDQGTGDFLMSFADSQWGDAARRVCRLRRWRSR
jgi:hypothetical protein